MENIYTWLQTHVSFQSIIGVALVCGGLWLFSTTIGVLIRLFLCAVLVIGGGYMFYHYSFGQAAEEKKAQDQAEAEKQSVMDSLRDFKGKVAEKTQQAKEKAQEYWQSGQKTAQEVNELNRQKDDLIRQKDSIDNNLNNFNRQINR